MPDTRRTLTPGDLAPWFVARTSRNSHYRFDSVAGRYLLLCFFGSAGDALSAAVLEAFGAQAGIDDLNVSFFDLEERLSCWIPHCASWPACRSGPARPTT